MVLPAGFDGDYNSLTNVPTNVSTFANDAGYLTSFTEVQALSISNDTIFLTGGSYVVLPVGSERQDLASVVSFGNQANGYQIKNVADPTDPQDAITLHYLDSVWRSLGLDSVQRGTYNNYVVSALSSVSAVTESILSIPRSRSSKPRKRTGNLPLSSSPSRLSMMRSAMKSSGFRPCIWPATMD